jgi:hypothetical protein
MSALFGGRRRERRSGEASAGPLADWVVSWLLHGRWPARDSAEWLAFTRTDEAAAWRAWADQLIARWTVEHPGMRPSSWWRAVAREAREVTPAPGMIVRRDAWNGAGVPVVLAAGGGLLFEKPVVVESQAAYLRRLRLLAPGEAKRVPQSAFRPEVGVPSSLPDVFSA